MTHLIIALVIVGVFAFVLTWWAIQNNRSETYSKDLSLGISLCALLLAAIINVIVSFR